MTSALAAPQPDVPTAERTRDRGLDAIRVLALALMVAAHFSFFIPASSVSAEALNFIGETAPAFFFFAFGMTFDRFLRKDRQTQVRRGLLLLWVALAHNLLVGQLHGARGLLQMDFFAFLWVCLVVLSTVEAQLRPSTRAYAVVLGVGAALLITPWGHHLLDMVESGVPGAFPLYPWGLFVVAGLLYSRAPRPHRSALCGAVAVAVGVALVVLQRSGFGLESWELAKRPMSGAYFLVTCGACAVIVAAAGRKSSASAPSPVVVFLSSNLLLCTVLHYVPVHAIGALSRYAASSANISTVLGPQSSYIAMWVGTAACFALVWPLTVGVLGFWERIRGWALFQEAGSRLAVTALLLLAIGQASVYGAHQLQWWSMNGADVPAWIASVTGALTSGILIAIMACAALQMRDSAAARRT